MEQQKLRGEYLSILSESHPGLTFDEYRDCCVFLLFYQYLCLKYAKELPSDYQLEMLVRMAVRGKLQIDSFLSFMEEADEYLSKQCPQIRLTTLSFYRRLYGHYAQEKQKSLARFIRKIVKKINAWEDKKSLYVYSGQLFGELMTEFSKCKKQTHISNAVLKLYEMFLRQTVEKKDAHVLQPEFKYGILLNNLVKDTYEASVYGYESSLEYREIFQILCYMNQKVETLIHIHDEKEWFLHKEYISRMDSIAIYLPEGVNKDSLESDALKYMGNKKNLVFSKTKGELSFLLAALEYLKRGGELAVVMPSALLYREGKEVQIRKYLIEDKNWLDTVIALPDQVFDSMGQQEVFLYFRKGRNTKDIMFFDCSERRLDKQDLEQIADSWKNREDIAGYCRNVSQESLVENGFNLNLPRYIIKDVEEEKIDLATRKQRLHEIEGELKSIEEKMQLYRRDLSIR